MAKHAVPKKKTSKGRSSRRYKSFQNRIRKFWNNKIQLIACTACGAKVKAHQVCPECGDYRGQSAVEIKEEAKVTTIKAD